LHFNDQLRTDPQGNFLAFKKIEAAVDIAKVLASSSNKIYLNADHLLFNVLPTPDIDKTAATATASK
jgi:hypothetical protein